MKKRIGFIGAGNMSGAIIGGLIGSGLVEPKWILASAKTKESLEKIEKKYRIETEMDNKKVAELSDYLVLGVKPYMYEEVLEEIRDSISRDTVVIIIAAGISIDYVKIKLGEDQIVVKTMPNTPAMVGEAMTAISFDDKIGDEAREEVLKIFKSFGQVEEIDEGLMDAFTAIAGSSPAYIYMLIEAMADGGVRGGIPRDKAYRMAAQAVLGSAKMVLETGLHPGSLKDNVCSPGGTSIEAVAKLEEKGFRTAIIEAMKVCEDKSKDLSRIK